jgi:hypothetical protein
LLSGVLMMLRAHFANEEEDIFPLAQELLGRTELDAVHDRYQTLKRSGES